MPMVPFQLDVEIRAPLAGGEVPTLDAVLLGEIVRTNPDAPDYAAGPDAAMEALKPLLKIAEGGIPQASALLFDGAPAGGGFVKTSRVRREFDAIQPMGLKVRGKNFAGGDSKYDNLLSGVSHRLVGDAQFLGVGDIGEIERTLRLWRGVGAQWRNGWGEVGEWQIRPADPADEKSWGLIENRRPLRPLPLELFAKFGGDPAWPTAHRRVFPPYWSASVPRVPAVVPDERRPSRFVSAPSAGAARPAADESAADFLLRRFARQMMPEAEVKKHLEKGGPSAAVQRAMSREYKHREKKRPDGTPKGLRLGDSAIAVVSERETLLLSHAVPEGAADDSFRAIPPKEGESKEAYRNLLRDAAMRPGPGARVIVAFEKRTPALEDLFMFSADSDHVVVSGKKAEAGVLYRSAVRRILEIARKGGFTRTGPLKKLRDDENHRRRDPKAGEAVFNKMEKERKRRNLSEDEWLDLQELLPALSPAGWAVLDAAFFAPENAAAETEGE